MPETPAHSPIGLSELIYQVKQDLLNDSKEDDPVPLFAVEEIQVEAAVVISRSGNAGIDIKVFSMGAGVSKEDTQTVRVTLRPLRSREELAADLSTEDPELHRKVVETSRRLVKSPETPGEPMSWPGAS